VSCRSLLCLAFACSLAGCGAAGAPVEEGPLAHQAAQAARAAGVPRDLVLAIAAVEGGLTLPKDRVIRADDEVPVAGILELRHGAYNSLARGAELVGSDENALRTDTDLGTVAGTMVLAELAQKYRAQPNDLESYRPAVAELSGLGGNYRDEYLAQVYAVLREGGAFPARGGETVIIPAHPEVAEPPQVLEQELGGPPPDFKGAIWFDTDCSANGGKCTAGRPDGNSSVDAIVIHDTEGGWAGSVATLQFDGGKSVHYIVDADGSRVGQFLHETDTAWHAGNWCWNKHSIGIEHVGVASDPSGYSDGLYKKSVALVKDIRSRWPKVPLDRAHIVGHYQIPNGNNINECSPACADTLDACEKSANYGGAGNHRDPGYYWQWCQYFQMLGGECTCNDAWPLWNCTTDKTEAVRCKNGKVEIEMCMPCESMPNGVDDVCHMAPMPDMAKPGGPDLEMGMGARDAGIVSRSDGSVLGGDAGDGTTVMNGCQCHVGARGDSRIAIGFALLLGLAIFRRRFSASDGRRG
jgi:MYXO-CTERM domain-containing protein